MLDTKKIKTEWDLSPFYKDDKDPKIEKDKKEVERKVNTFVNKWEKRTDWLKDPKVLKEALDDYEVLMANYNTFGKPGAYFHYKSYLNQLDPFIKAQNNKMNDFEVRLDNSIQFFTHRLAKIDKKSQKAFLKDKGLFDYRHFLESLFEEARYLLSEAEEKILSLKTQTSHSNWVKMVGEFLSKEEKEILNEKNQNVKASFEVILKTAYHGKSKKRRDIAAKAFNEILEKHSDSAEHELNSILQNKKIDDELRGLDRPDKLRHLSDDMDSEVVDALIKAVTKNFTVTKKYYKLKAKILKLDKLAYHERQVPVGEVKGNYSFNQSCKLVYETLYSVNSEFGSIFKRFLENGQIDVFPKKGKSSGAFCSYTIKKFPTYVLLNHNNTLNDVTTIAHELGHGINNELMREQNSLNFRTPLSTAEVASTFMEDFVFSEITKNLNDEEKFIIKFEKLNDEVSSIYRQVAAYNFETELHNSFRSEGYLPKKEIGKIFSKNMKAYMGNYVSQDKGSENWWVYWSHFRTFFYVYSYASGLLISKALQAKVKQDPKFIKQVKQFLSAGSSDSPKNLFLKMGIDITKPEFWDTGLLEIKNDLDEAEKLAKKLGKI